MNELKENVRNDTILYCSSCKYPVKPDVVLFGENQDPNFFTSFQKIKQADLVFVMGTSQKVAPFNMLVSMVNKNVPIVLQNMEQSMKSDLTDKFLWMEGDIDQSVQKILDFTGWNDK